MLTLTLTVARTRLPEPTGVDVDQLAALDTLSERLSRHVKPGTTPLLDVHGFYETRSPRL